MPSTNHPHPELAPKAHVEGRTIDLQRSLLFFLCGLCASSASSASKPCFFSA
jgi:hypothetical protein